VFELSLNVLLKRKGSSMFTFPREIGYSTCVRMMNVKSMGIKGEIFFSKKKKESRRKNDGRKSLRNESRKIYGMKFSVLDTEQFLLNK
jgi:hypothetical protein